MSLTFLQKYKMQGRLQPRPINCIEEIKIFLKNYNVKLDREEVQ